MSYNNYYGSSGGSYGARSGGYGGGGYGSGNGYTGGYGGRFSQERPQFFPSQERPQFFPSNSGSHRKDMYKSGGGGRFSDQEQRRKSLLNDQRDRRNNFQNKGRNFGSQNNYQKRKPAFSKPASNGPPRPREYKDILSYSEYLEERPDDLEQWVVVACPKGKRCTLVAHKGITTMFDKAGKPIDSFLSHLPGGCDAACLMTTHGGMRKTILDCIYSEADHTYYVLDIIMWNMHPFVECETSLRFFWLQTRMLEVDVATRSKSNQFRILPAVRFDVINSQQNLLEPNLYPQNKPMVDGFLFYHPEAIYQSGSTPLVGWLKGFMIPDIIDHIQLNEIYLKEKPSDYTNLSEYVAKHGNSYGKKKKKSGKDGEKMETDAAAPAAVADAGAADQDYAMEAN